MADIPTIKGLRGLIAGGQMDLDTLMQFFQAGGSPNELMRLALSGSVGMQQKEAVRGQREQLGLRQALLNQGGISNLQNRQAFNPFGGPQELQGSPLAGIDFSQVFGGQEQGFAPQPPPQQGGGLEFEPGQEGGGGVPQAQQAAPETRPSAVQLQRQAFLEALKRRGGPQ